MEQKIKPKQEIKREKSEERIGVGKGSWNWKKTPKEEKELKRQKKKAANKRAKQARKTQRKHDS